ncbi:MAG: hypothetical protein WKI04_06725 [Ferruginibacter sp.]
MNHPKKPEHHIRPYKIAAQSAGLVASIFVLFFIAGKGVPLTLKSEDNNFMPFILMLILPVTGYLISWYKEFTGSLLMEAGGIILLVYFITKHDTAMGLTYGLPFVIAGILFFVHIGKRIQLKRKEERT